VIYENNTLGWSFAILDLLCYCTGTHEAQHCRSLPHYRESGRETCRVRDTNHQNQNSRKKSIPPRPRNNPFGRSTRTSTQGIVGAFSSLDPSSCVFARNFGKVSVRSFSSIQTKSHELPSSIRRSAPPPRQRVPDRSVFRSAMPIVPAHAHTAVPAGGGAKRCRRQREQLVVGGSIRFDSIRFDSQRNATRSWFRERLRRFVRSRFPRRRTHPRWHSGARSTKQREPTKHGATIASENACGVCAFPRARTEPVSCRRCGGASFVCGVVPSFARRVVLEGGGRAVHVSKTRPTEHHGFVLCVVGNDRSGETQYLSLSVLRTNERRRCVFGWWWFASTQKHTTQRGTNKGRPKTAEAGNQKRPPIRFGSICNRNRPF